MAICVTSDGGRCRREPCFPPAFMECKSRGCSQLLGEQIVPTLKVRSVPRHIREDQEAQLAVLSDATRADFARRTLVESCGWQPWYARLPGCLYVVRRGSVASQLPVADTRQLKPRIAQHSDGCRCSLIYFSFRLIFSLGDEVVTAYPIFRIDQSWQDPSAALQS